MRTLLDAIQLAESEEIDGLWAILKYKDIGTEKTTKLTIAFFCI